MLEPFRLAFVQRGVVDILLLSAGAGILGTWIVLRGLAFYSHAVGTAAFPGLVLADGLGFAPGLGAFGAAVLFAGGMSRLTRDRSERYDSLTALALVGALVIGVILASDVFHSGSQVDTLLFGSLLTIGPGDILLAAAMSALTVVANAALGARWLATGFDAAGARALRIPTRWTDAALLVLIALAITAALSTAGALLATALFVVPAATTRLWIRRVAPWQVLTVALVAVEAVAGLWLSVRVNAPPGPAISTIAGAAFVVSAVAARIRARARTRASRRSRGRPAAWIAAPAAALALFASACGSSAANGSNTVVATTTQIGDWVRTVAGTSVSVDQILQPNTDPHDYEPRPKDVEAVGSADLIFENGDGLDAWMSGVVHDAGGHPVVVVLGDHVPALLPGETSGSEASRYDAHWWHDPRNAVAAVTLIRDALDRAFPAARASFDANADSYLRQLRSMDSAIRGCFQQVPPAERKLVTDHDAFSYFAARYGIRVIGAVIPSQTTQGEASAQDLAGLIDLIRREHVRAVFPESSLSPKLVQTIAGETGASAAYTLYGDTLGPAGSPGATYVSMEQSNADAMVRGFTGGASSCVFPSS
jgi:ABC-type Zn uptake system ZnuABC Zn-binding protein ZnuA/ABC-type Mn2+/Zn2+ transport system permease subunit